MTTTAEMHPEKPFLTVPEGDRFGRGVTSRGELWSKLQGIEATLRILRAQDSPEGERLLEQLLYRLTLAKSCIEGQDSRQRIRRNDPQFWGLVHGIEADMLLLMPPAMLATQALEVEEQFRRNVEESISRQTWLGLDGNSGPLPKAVKTVLDGANSSGNQGSEDGGLTYARNVLRGAIQLVNKQSDRRFRQLAFALLVRSLSGVLLVLLFVAAFFFNMKAWLPESASTFPLTTWHVPLPMLSLLLLGAAGAILANMTSEPPVLAARGPRWRQFVYYLFVRPAIGAFAAFLFYLLARSQLLFSIEQAFGQESTTQPPAIRIVLSGPVAVDYAFAIISIAVGFSADRVLSSTMDKVLSRLFHMADKNVQSPNLPPTALAQSRVPDVSSGPSKDTSTKQGPPK
ncbi:hypothetical protein HMI51_12785 [Corallococcus coralloides]|nr:hypothetical protein [Corallococcus coralloides]